MQSREGLSRFLADLEQAERDGVARLCGVPEGLAPAALADSLARPAATITALLGLDAFALQILEGLLAVATDGRVAAAALGGLVDSRATPAQVEQALGRLRARALAWRDGEAVVVSRRVLQVLPRPAGLGPPAAEVVPLATIAQLDPVARGAGEEPARPKARLVEQVTRLLADPERFAAALAAAPAPALRVLTSLEAAGGFAQQYGDARPGTPQRWLTDRGLLLVDNSGYRVTVPRETSLALRGGRVLASLQPVPPGSPRPQPAPLSGAAGAPEAASLLADAAAVLQGLDAAVVPALKAGGLGVRELRRLAGALSLPEPRLRLVVELLGLADLVLPWDGQVLPTRAADGWLSAPPEAQWEALAVAWLAGTAPLSTGSGPALPLPSRALRGPLAAPELLRTLTSLDPGTCLSVRDLAERLLWCNPLRVAATPGVPTATAAVLAEAAALGIAVGGALTEAGWRLAEGLPAAAAALLGPRLPRPETRALVGSDLTVVVPGLPAPSLAALLDALADRESRGAGVTWRLSPASVRRALDAGRDPDADVTALRAAAGGSLPPVVDRLFADVRARHGEIEVGPAATWLRIGDAGLAAAVAADRRLASLGLVTLGDGALASAQPPPVVLQRLRAAGYLPRERPGAGGPPDRAAGGEPGSARRRRAPTPRAMEPEWAPQWQSDWNPGGCDCPECRGLPGLGWTSDEEDLEDDQEADGVVLEFPMPDDAVISRLAAQLPGGDRTCLLAALRTGRPVEVDYEDTRGRRTTRRLRELALEPPYLVAWCELREDARTFALGGLRAVRA